MYANLRVDPEFEAEYSLNTPANLILQPGETYYFIYGNFQRLFDPKEKSVAVKDERQYEEIRKYMFYESGKFWVK